MSKQDFINGFLEAAMWLGQSYENEAEAERGEGTDLRDIIDTSEIPTDVMKEITDDCEAFYDNYSHLWEGELDDVDAGHDFFLTRNRHGSGFWDRDLEHADELTDAAHVYGSFNLERFADGPVYATH